MCLPAAQLTDMHVCPLSNGPVPHVGGPIIAPACLTVLIEGMSAARMTDMLTCIGPPSNCHCVSKLPRHSSTRR
jgi:uncharacterized Zn-binding protein involved in type VI secretion